MRGLLFGIAPHDPATFVAASLVMVLLGVVACWIPALRAARVSPVVTMRSMQ
jgi:putative ABC transport system permease protein